MTSLEDFSCGLVPTKGHLHFQLQVSLIMFHLFIRHQTCLTFIPKILGNSKLRPFYFIFSNK